MSPTVQDNLSRHMADDHKKMRNVGAYGERRHAVFDVTWLISVSSSSLHH